MTKIFVSILFCLGIEAGARAEIETPYIDEIRSEMEPTPPRPSVIETIKKDPLQQDARGSYIETLRQEDPERFQSPEFSSYIDRERAKMESVPTESAIARVRQGRSELKMVRVGDIHWHLGFRFGTFVSPAISSGADYQANAFGTIYKKSFNPEGAIFGEYQPFHSEWLGNFGVFGSLGFGQYNGLGLFRFLLSNSQTGESFGETSRTDFQFYVLPVVVGLSYRFNLLRIFRPYAVVGPSLVGFMERRLDGKSPYRGYTKAISGTGGVSVMLDWFSKDAAWNLYSEHGIKHFYLNIEYNRFFTIASPVTYAASGFYAGLSFEI